MGATPTPRSRRRPWLLIILELLIAGSALYGGVALIWNNALGMPADWLQATPFTTWVLPGVFLLLIVAGPMITAAVLELRRSSWSTVGSVLAGSADVGWIAAQLLIIEKYNVLQPVMIIAGLAVILLALWAARGRPPIPFDSWRQ